MSDFFNEIKEDEKELKRMEALDGTEGYNKDVLKEEI